MNTQEFIERAKKIHGDNKYDYSLVEYKNYRTKIKIICKEHGIFEQRPENHLIKKSNCPECINNKRLTTEEFIKRAKQIHGNKYDYSLINYKNNTEKVKIICKEHGIFEQRPIHHVNKKCGCKKCFINKTKLTTQEFIERANEIHGNKYDYSLVEYGNLKTKIKIICKEHGIFEQFPDHHINQNCGCVKCPLIVKISNPHQKIIKFLEELNLKENEDFIINDRSIINPLELDLYFSKHRLAIEINGAFWHSTNNFEELNIYKYRHLNKLNESLKSNIDLLQFTDMEINKKFDLVRSMIKQKLGLSEKIYARKTKLKELIYGEVKEFLNNNHMQGYKIAKINLGLFYNNELVQLMSFDKPFLNKNFEWELVRLCTKQNFTVIGGSERLFSYFKENYLKNDSIISYCDRRFFNGKIYKKLEFEFIKNTQPNYIYLDKNGHYIGSRYKFQKKKLSKFLFYFDENKTEIENMLNNENRILFDCGNSVWFYKSIL